MNTPSGLDANTEKKIDELLKKMTLDEKVGQLNQYNGTWDVTGPAPQSGDEKARYEALVKGKVGSMLNVLSVAATREAQQLAVEKTRLGIPLIFGYDVIHGYRTMFPIPLAEAASWDLEAVELSARIAAVETAAAGVHWTFAPMIDIGRDARWGRVMEGSGEDTYLGTLMGAARVRGFQGDDLSKPDTIAACAKHFAAYGFAEGGRDYNTVDISDHTLHNVVLPPFKACVEAGVATVMNGFNELGGMPVTGNAYLQRDLLKGEWGFDGFVISDWASIGEMQIHGVAANKKEAAHLAITAGSDMDMESNCYVETLADLVKSGEVDEALVDDAVRRVLRIKFRLGLFDDPYRYCDENREKEKVGAAEHLELSRQVAKKSIVLLKNENVLLPLPKTGKTIAVIGPLAADKDVPLGSWRGQAITGSAVSLLEGVQQAVGEDTEVLYAEGCKLAIGERSFTQELTINQEDKSGFAEAIEVAKKADVVVLAIGEDAWQSGEGRSQVSIELAGVQEALLKEIHRVNPNIVMVLMNGRPLAIQWAAANVPAILEVWHLGSAAGLAIADVLFGDFNPAGKLPISFPHVTGQVPIYYNQKNTGRPTNSSNSVFWSHYTDSPKTPLFPFGFGLSYTTFAYGNLALSTDTISMNESLRISVKVTNTGKRAGEEVVQLYIRDLVGSVTRPVKELKGFKKIHLEPGASETVDFELRAKDLAFYTRAGKWQAEPGDFKVFVGTSSVETQEASFRLVQRMQKHLKMKTHYLLFLILITASFMSCESNQPSKSLTIEIFLADSLQKGPLDGRLLLLFSKDDSAEPRFQIQDGVKSQQIFGMDVEGWDGKSTLVMDARSMGYPVESLNELPAGEYWVQTLFHKYETFARGDGYTVKMPMDRGEGQQWNRAPGNLYSLPQEITVEKGGTISLKLDQVIPPIPEPEDTEYIKHIKIKSKLLSEFWGRDMYLGAHVLLPEGWAEHPEVKYPLAIMHGHFPSDFGGWRTEPVDTTEPCVYSERFGVDCYNHIVQQEAYDFYKMWTGPDFPRVIAIEIQHANPFYDDSYAVNSANVGPYGDAITHELIPYIEEQFRGIGDGWARFTYGGSTGGWEALAVQTFYPDEYNGCYAACPDPIDFRAYCLVNIYEDKNAYFVDGAFQKIPRPGHRDYLGNVNSTLKGLNDLELALGSNSRSGQQWDIWQAVYSPVGEDGYPKPIWDKMTGDIDPKVANYWKENYDLAYILKRDWSQIGHKLRGKIHIYCGDMDNYYLNNAVYLMEDFLKETTEPHYDGEVDYGDRAEHCWNGDHSQPNHISRLRYHRMFIPKWAEEVKNRAPRGADLESWRY